MRALVIFLAILGMCAGFLMFWIAICTLVGVRPYPLPQDGFSKSVATLICLGVMVISRIVATSVVNSDPKPTKRTRKDDVSDVIRTLREDVGSLNRYRVTTARENEPGVEVNEVEGQTEAEATAFATLTGVRVISVEKLSDVSRTLREDAGPLNRYRVTTARENEPGVDVNDVEGHTEAEATAFATLTGVRVISIEKLS